MKNFNISQFFNKKKILVGNKKIKEMSCTNNGIVPRAEKFKKKLSKSIKKNLVANKGDFVFGLSRKKLNFGMMDLDEGCFSSAYKVYSCNGTYEFSKFLDIYMRENHDYFYSCIEGGAREGQSINENILLSLKVEVPDNKTINNIVNLNNLLEKKIELNNLEIKLINKILKKFYEKLFINIYSDQNPKIKLNDIIKDYFKGDLKTNISENLPSGWSIKKLKDCSQNYDSRRVPLSKKKRFKLDNIYPYYGASGIIDYVNNYIFDGEFLLIGEDGSVEKEDGTAFSQYVNKKFWLNNHAHILEGKKEISTMFLYITFKFLKISNIVSGAVQKKITKTNLENIELVIPKENLLKEFNNIAKPFFKRIIHKEKEISFLVKSKDNILKIINTKPNKLFKISENLN